jgi:uncharacterized protein YdhG (YjbR/CyaY superfamily)
MQAKDNWRKVCTVTTHSSISSIDEYIARFPAHTRQMLEELRALIKAAAPDATETISYGIPTFDLDGRHLVFFAGYERHVGLYPAPVSEASFLEDLKPYKKGRGSVQFPLSEPLPKDLVRRIVAFEAARRARAA